MFSTTAMWEESNVLRSLRSHYTHSTLITLFRFFCVTNYIVRISFINNYFEGRNHNLVNNNRLYTALHIDFHYFVRILGNCLNFLILSVCDQELVGVLEKPRWRHG